MGKVTSQFVILTQTVNNQLLSLSWGVLFFPFTFEARGEGLRKEVRLNNFLSLKRRGLIFEGGLN